VPNVSCSTCHDRDRGFDDDRDVSEVIVGMPVARNSPTILNAAWMNGFAFWDGRADSLWSQPLFAFEGPNEMGTTRLAIAHRIYDTPAYRTAYEEIFGALPPLEDLARFPALGKPGDASFDMMPSADKQAIDGVVANVGKALEAYMRRLAAPPSRVDRYIGGDRNALDADERLGFAQFVRSGCTGCHSGPALADGAYYQVRTNPSMDRGRAHGIEVLLTSPFNSAGPFFDDDAGEPLPLPRAPMPTDEGAFRTPSLRNVEITAPYGHAGMFIELRDILQPDGMPLPDDALIEPFLLALTSDPVDEHWAAAPAP
jgi:cytochrome c peroxidase